MTGFAADSRFKDLLRRFGVTVPEGEITATARKAGSSKLKKWSCGCTNVRCGVGDFQAAVSEMWQPVPTAILTNFVIGVVCQSLDDLPPPQKEVLVTQSCSQDGCPGQNRPQTNPKSFTKADLRSLGKSIAAVKPFKSQVSSLTAQT